MQDYLVNFFVWWYAIVVRDVVVRLRKVEYYLLNTTYTLDMISNLGKPLYQDYSGIGRFIGFIIRGTWAGVGLLIAFIVLIPLLVVGAFVALLPIIAVTQIVLGVIFVIL